MARLRYLLFTEQFVNDWINQCQSITFAFERSRVQTQSGPVSLFSCFFVCFWISGVQIPVKIVIFSTVFNSHGTYGKKFSIKHTLGCTRCPQAESGGNRSKIYFCILLLSKKIQKFEFFKFPSFNFDDIFIKCCPHAQ